MKSAKNLTQAAEPNNGVFIVIEGTDGSGKTTQYDRLYNDLTAKGYDVERIHFPRYDEPSSYFVNQYLQGNYGSADEVGPYTASLFYALDRYQAAQQINDWLNQGKVVLCDRFTGANMAHQGAKFDNVEERRGYFIWLDNLEFETLGIPRPTLTMVLNTPLKTILERLEAKRKTDSRAQKDIHEINPKHLEKSLEVYLDLCQLFPKDFYRIDTRRSGTLLDINAVALLIQEKLAPLLPSPTLSQQQVRQRQQQEQQQTDSGQPSSVQTPPQPAAAIEPQKPAADNGDNPYVTKDGKGTHLTAEGEAFLSTAVTNPTGQVYGFTERFSPVTIAAAMARLSRRGDDMRLTLMDEFAHAMGKDEQLLHRVITAYGDDSVQQLVGIPMVVEDASQLLTKKLEWGRLASYLEQSTRYIYYDQRDKNGKFRYVTPEHFDQATKKAYDQAMETIFQRYSTMVRKLTDFVRDRSSVPEAERDVAWKGATRAQACDAARAVLPVATKTTVGLYASGQALESLIMRLLSDDLPEARTTGEQLLIEARKVVPAFLERADKPDRGGARVAYQANTYKAVQKIADELLPAHHADGVFRPAVLTDVWPRNEFDIIADMLYEHSSLPLSELRSSVDSWTYDQKLDAFQAYMGERLNRRHKPGRALEKIHYSWDLTCDYGLFRELQRHRMVDDLNWQALTPRHGYEVPKLIEDAGLTDLFEDCFDLSLSLYSRLQQNGYTLEAQYAVLLGHRMRWKVTYNAREAFHLHELRTSPQAHPTARKLLQEMHAKVAEIHPTLADAMRFVNQDEDPELTRLAAERYTQYKLGQLGGKPSEEA